MMEDGNIFPGLRAQKPALGATIDKLTEDHHKMDPMLERGDRAFAGLPGTAADAAAVVADLRALLDTHLALEEAELVPLLRAAKQFPTPANDAEADQFAQ